MKSKNEMKESNRNNTDAKSENEPSEDDSDEVPELEDPSDDESDDESIEDPELPKLSSDEELELEDSSDEGEPEEIPKLESDSDEVPELEDPNVDESDDESIGDPELPKLSSDEDEDEDEEGEIRSREISILSPIKSEKKPKKKPKKKKMSEIEKKRTGRWNRRLKEQKKKQKKRKKRLQKRMKEDEKREVEKREKRRKRARELMRKKRKERPKKGKTPRRERRKRKKKRKKRKSPSRSKVIVISSDEGKKKMDDVINLITSSSDADEPPSSDDAEPPSSGDDEKKVSNDPINILPTFDEKYKRVVQNNRKIGFHVTDAAKIILSANQLRKRGLVNGRRLKQFKFEDFAYLVEKPYSTVKKDGESWTLTATRTVTLEGFNDKLVYRYHTHKLHTYTKKIIYTMGGWCLVLYHCLARYPEFKKMDIKRDKIKSEEMINYARQEVERRPPLRAYGEVADKFYILDEKMGLDDIPDLYTMRRLRNEYLKHARLKEALDQGLDFKSEWNSVVKLQNDIFIKRFVHNLKVVPGGYNGLIANPILCWVGVNASHGKGAEVTSLDYKNKNKDTFYFSWVDRLNFFVEKPNIVSAVYKSLQHREEEVLEAFTAYGSVGETKQAKAWKIDFNLCDVPCHISDFERSIQLGKTAYYRSRNSVSGSLFCERHLENNAKRKVKELKGRVKGIEGSIFIDDVTVYPTIFHGDYNEYCVNLNDCKPSWGDLLSKYYDRSIHQNAIGLLSLTKMRFGYDPAEKIYNNCAETMNNVIDWASMNTETVKVSDFAVMLCFGKYFKGVITSITTSLMGLGPWTLESEYEKFQIKREFFILSSKKRTECLIRTLTNIFKQIHRRGRAIERRRARDSELVVLSDEIIEMKMKENNVAIKPEFYQFKFCEGRRLIKTGRRVKVLFENPKVINVAVDMKSRNGKTTKTVLFHKSVRGDLLRIECVRCKEPGWLCIEKCAAILYILALKLFEDEKKVWEVLSNGISSTADLMKSFRTKFSGRKKNKMKSKRSKKDIPKRDLNNYEDLVQLPVPSAPKDDEKPEEIPKKISEDDVEEDEEDGWISNEEERYKQEERRRKESEIPADITPLKIPADITPLKIPADITPLKIPADITPLKIPAITPLKIPAITPLKIPADITPLKIPADITPLKIPADISPVEDDVYPEPTVDEIYDAVKNFEKEKQKEYLEKELKYRKLTRRRKVASKKKKDEEFQSGGECVDDKCCVCEFPFTGNSVMCNSCHGNYHGRRPKNRHGDYLVFIVCGRDGICSNCRNSRKRKRGGKKDQREIKIPQIR